MPHKRVSTKTASAMSEKRGGGAKEADGRKSGVGGELEEKMEFEKKKKKGAEGRKGRMEVNQGLGGNGWFPFNHYEKTEQNRN